MTPELRTAWLLHSRPYKERSLLADFLVAGEGRVPMVVRRKGRSSARATGFAVQPFSQLMVSWRGRGELKTLSAIEPEYTLRLTGKNLFCGLYVNELILRTVLAGQPVEGLIELYTVVAHQLAERTTLEPVLRYFELELLALMGYLPSLQHDVKTGAPFSPGSYCRFQPGSGLVLSSDVLQGGDRRYVYRSEVVEALARRDFSNTDYYPDFKRFTRQALSTILGNRPLKSRELFTRK